MAKAAISEALRVGSGKHLEQTKRHMQRLDNRLSSLGEKSSGKKCKGMEGLIEQGQEVIEERNWKAKFSMLGSSPRRSPSSITKSLRTVVSELTQTSSEKQRPFYLLEETLQKEKETDERLTDLAESINAEAAGSGELEGAENPGTTRKRKAARA
jgi:ferritin-like metal-binding protein YciE